MKINKLDNYIQLASFHPNFTFEGNNKNSVENYTNKSPYPIIHLLQVNKVKLAIESVNGKTDIIWQRNIKLLNSLGLKDVKEKYNNLFHS